MSWDGIWQTIKDIIVVVLVICAIVLIIWACMAGPGVVFLGLPWLTPGIAMALGVGLLLVSFVLFPEETKEFLGEVTEAAVEVAGKVIEAVVDAGIDVAGSIFSKLGLGGWLLFGAAGYFTYKALSSDSSNESVSLNISDPLPDGPVGGPDSEGSENVLSLRA